MGHGNEQASLDEIKVDGRMWRKSSISESGTCVEVNLGSQMVLVRDSKNPDGGVLCFSHPEWRAFLAGVRLGEFEV
jgi:hypothetical protein